MKLGAYVYGLAAIATGVIDIVWGGFESAHQPIQAFGDNVPGQRILAYIIGAAFVAGGAAVLSPRTARIGSIVLAIVYAIFTIFWLPRLYTAPHFLGFHAGVIVSVLGGVCQQLILVAAAWLIYEYTLQPAPLRRGASLIVRWVFGLSSIDFGLAHLTGISTTAALVPKWLPFGQDFWVVLTGIAFVLAGVAIVTEIWDVAAARLLASMLLVFSAFALAPGIIAYPHNQIPWGSNAYNIAAVAAVWIFASCIAVGRRQTARVNEALPA
jgi:uncharacterized membrane protein